MNNLFHETADKLFIKQKSFKSPSLNSRSLNYQFKNQLSKLTGKAACDSNINHNNILKQLTTNSNGSPFHQPQSKDIQSNLHKKRASVNFYSQFLHKMKTEEEEEQKHQNKINIMSQYLHPRQSVQHSQQYLFQVLNTNSNTINTTSSQSCSNINTNNNLSTTESSQHHNRHISKKKLNSPHMQQHLKLQHQPSIKEAIHYTPNIHNYNHSRLKANASSYCLSPAVGASKHTLQTNNILLYSMGHKHFNNSSSSHKEGTVNEFEVESNLNEIQFLGPDIPLRRFVSGWEPIERFEISNVFAFTNYGSTKNVTQDVDPNTKNIINNIIITSSANKNQVEPVDIETERKAHHFQNRSITSNNDNVHSKINLKTYASINEIQQKQKKKKFHHKKKSKLLCCV